MKRVVITGLGTINSIGHNVEDSFKAVVAGECGIDTITLFDITEFPVKIAGEVKDFDPTTVKVLDHMLNNFALTQNRLTHRHL